MKKSLKLVLAALAAATLITLTACSGGGGAPAASNTTTPGNNGLINIFGNNLPSAASTASVPAASLPTTSIPTTSIPTTSVPTTSVPTTSVPQTSVPASSAMAGTYGVAFSAEYQQQIANMTAEEQQILQYMLASTLVLNPNGTLTYTIAGTNASGTWTDHGNGTVTIHIEGGNEKTFTFANGMIYDPNEMESYFVKK